MEKESLINKLLESQFLNVFQKLDTDSQESLSMEQFEVFLYSIGLNFINKYYADDINEQLFAGNPKNRVKFSDFIKYIEEQSLFDYSKQEYKQSLDLFDYDKNGSADIADIRRVLKNYSSLSDSQAEHFVKLNLLNDPDLNLDDDLDKQKAVNIKESVKTLYSV